MSVRGNLFSLVTWLVSLPIMELLNFHGDLVLRKYVPREYKSLAKSNRFTVWFAVTICLLFCSCYVLRVQDFVVKWFTYLIIRIFHDCMVWTVKRHTEGHCLASRQSCWLNVKQWHSGQIFCPTKGHDRFFFLHTFLRHHFDLGPSTFHQQFNFNVLYHSGLYRFFHWIPISNNSTV